MLTAKFHTIYQGSIEQVIKYYIWVRQKEKYSEIKYDEKIDGHHRCILRLQPMYFTLKFLPIAIFL